MAIPTERDLLLISSFARGANNIANESSIPRGSCRSATNVDFYPGGRFRRRAGSTLNWAGSGANAIWSNGHYALMRIGTTVAQFKPGQAPVTLLTNINPENRMVYCEVNQYILVSDGVRSWRVNPTTNAVRMWGLPEPGQCPIVATATGGLDAGAYQVALTGIDATRDESGATIAMSVDVAQGGGIALSNIPQPTNATITGIRVYVTKPGDKILLRYATLPLGVTTLQIVKQELGAPLRSQFLSPIPGVTAAAFTAGRLFFAFDNIVGYSDSLVYGLWNPALNYIEYPAPISMLAPASMAQASTAVTGIFVATTVFPDGELPTGRTYFLSGAQPADYSNVPAYNAGAVPGTMSYVPGAYFEDDQLPTDTLPVWVATNGTLCAGLPAGTVRGLTEGRYAMAVGTQGSAAFRELNGIRQLLLSMQPLTDTMPIAASDSVTITRVKNGIVQQ